MSSDVDPTLEAGAFVIARPSGEILVASGQTSDAAVLRVNADGSPDPEFGDDGVVAIFVPSSTDSRSRHVQRPADRSGRAPWRSRTSPWCSVS